MDNTIDPERALAIGYARPAARPGLDTLFALDSRLAGIVARTGEATIGLMRLTWWRDALDALDTAPPPAEPLLQACAMLSEDGVPGAALAAMTSGWEALLDDPDLGDAAVALHATERGARLFALAADILAPGHGETARMAAAGDGWARVDLARHLDRPARVPAVLASAIPPLDHALAGRWPKSLRPLGQLALLARRDASGIGVPASRGRLLRIMAFHLTGR